MTIRTIIVEDELHSLKRMKKLLKGFDEIQVVGEAQDGTSAISMIDKLKPDLAFLDIQLPEFTSFEVLDHVSHKPMVIFVTAYNQYAIKAFEENAVDYILKPSSEERLGKAIERVIQLNQIIDSNTIEILKKALEKKEYLQRFTVKVGLEILVIPANKVYWFSAKDKYVFLHTFDREYIYDSTLKELEQILNPEQFCRIHKSVIVSLDKILKFTRSLLGDYILKLNDKNNTKIKIGRSYLTNIRKKFKF